MDHNRRARTIRAWSTAIAWGTLTLLLVGGCAGPVDQEVPIADLTGRSSAWGFPVTDEQREKLADNYVSDSEFASAVDDRSDCLAARGIRVESMRDGLGDLTAAVQIQDTGGFSDDETAAILATCYEEHLGVVYNLYTFQKYPLPEERAGAQSRAIACLTKLGVTGLADPSSYDQVMQTLEVQLTSDDEFNRAWVCFAKEHAFDTIPPLDSD